MAEEVAYHKRGLAGKQHPVTGEVTRSGVKFLVVQQVDSGDEPVEYGHFSNQDDAVLYQRSMAAQGTKGLRVVAANGKD